MANINATFRKIRVQHLRRKGKVTFLNFSLRLQITQIYLRNYLIDLLFMLIRNLSCSRRLNFNCDGVVTDQKELSEAKLRRGYVKGANLFSVMLTAVVKKTAPGRCVSIQTGA